MEWAATERVAVVKVAIPPASVPVPSVVAPSLNVTVPVAAEGETVAVNVTGTPAPAGFSDEVSEVVVAAWLTVCATAAEVLAALLLSPPYTAVCECVPTVSVVVEKLAVPPATVPVPIVVAPSLNVTVPVAFEGVTVAVSVTDVPKLDG